MNKISNLRKIQRLSILALGLTSSLFLNLKILKSIKSRVYLYNFSVHVYV